MSSGDRATKTAQRRYDRVARFYDFSEALLERAGSKARAQGVKVGLSLMDVQDLAFPTDTFESVVASFIFCSVPDPIRGLTELCRVLKPGGKAVFLEHVLSSNPIIAWLMNLANPVVVRVVGANMNRKTVENVQRSGLIVEEVSDLWAGIFKFIEARKAG